tara:strand:- start:49 stop:804 length:756 start_codon:yes stop_codon:yes gene_type:complete
MRVEIKTVTPAMAEGFLQTNKSNRKINKNQLEMIKRTMLNGEWVLTHQGVALYDDGTLADGQHRLTAIVQTGVKCKMPIFYGIKKSTVNIMAIDCGKMRSVKDSASITGVKLNPSQIALAKALHFGIKSNSKLTHKESVALVEQYSHELEVAKFLLPSNRAGISSVSVKAGLVKAYKSGVSKELLKEICTILYKGAGDYSQALALRNLLLSQTYTGNKGREIAFNMVLNTCMAIKNGDFNFVISGDKIWTR